MELKYVPAQLGSSSDVVNTRPVLSMLGMIGPLEARSVKVTFLSRLTDSLHKSPTNEGAEVYLSIDSHPCCLSM